MNTEAPDREKLIGKQLRQATYTVSEVDVADFLGVVAEPEFASPVSVDGLAGAKGGGLAPPSFAPFVAVLGLLKTFDWREDFLFDYQTGTAMFGEQEIEFHRPLRVGEAVVIDASVHDVYEKQGKKRFDVIDVSFQIDSATVGDRIMSGRQSYILFK